MSRAMDKGKLDILLEDKEWDSLLEDDEEFDAAVKEAYIREAEEIEKSLFPEGAPKTEPVSGTETQASYEKLVAMMKKRGIYREDPPAANAAANSSGSRNTMAFAGDGMAIAANGNSAICLQLPDGSAESVRKRSCRALRRQFKAVRVAGISVACLLGVFLVSMTSEANRKYVMQTVKYLMGDGAYVTINNDSKNEKAQRDEAEIREKIEKTIDAKVPEIKYRPDTFEFYNYYIREDALMASMEYMYEGSIITLDIYNYDSDLASQNIGMHGDNRTTFYVEEDNIQVVIIETFDDNEKIPSYTAKWEKENVFYQLSGRVEKKILQKIIKNIKY